MTIKTKICRHCKIDQSIDNFKSKKGRETVLCKKCRDRNLENINKSREDAKILQESTMIECSKCGAIKNINHYIAVNGSICKSCSVCRDDARKVKKERDEANLGYNFKDKRYIGRGSYPTTKRLRDMIEKRGNIIFT